jgi:DNA-binding XRE family transcriptional regulator
MQPPIKTTVSDIDALFNFLKGQVGWVPLDRVRKTIDSKLSDNRKLEACRYLGLIERDGTNIKLSESGQVYANGDEKARAEVMLAALKGVPLYYQTIEWIHHNNKAEPTKTDVGNYWHDKLQSELDGAKDTALTDAVIFFFRIADAAGLGKFIAPGRGRPIALLRSDLEAIKTVATAAPVVQAESAQRLPVDSATLTAVEKGSPAQGGSLAVAPANLKVSPDIHINLEIHIAADAMPDTVEEIFKNMRKYVLDYAN